MHGPLPFLERYQQSKKGPRPQRRVDPLLKRWVWALREREAGCCVQKIAYFLDMEHGLHLSVPYEILHEEHIIRSKRKSPSVGGPCPRPVPRARWSRWAPLCWEACLNSRASTSIRKRRTFFWPTLTPAYGRAFLEQTMGRRFGGYLALIHTDGGSEFKEAFTDQVLAYCQRHRVARPYKKNEQAYIESFNRTVRKSV